MIASRAEAIATPRYIGRPQIPKCQPSRRWCGKKTYDNYFQCIRARQGCGHAVSPEEPNDNPSSEHTQGLRHSRRSFWRRRRDSNPRGPFEPNGFQDRRFQPLTHSSVSKYNVRQLLVGFLVTFLTPVAACWCILSPNRHQNFQVSLPQTSWSRDLCARSTGLP